MESLLNYFNFSPEEIKVYQCMLKLGGAKASTIAAKLGLKRTSCQEYIGSLMDKGFVNSAKIGNKFFYQAEDPDKFRQVINEREHVLDRLMFALRNQDQAEPWQVQSLDKDDVRLGLQRAQKKNQTIREFGNKTCGGAVVDNQSVILWSDNKDLPNIRIQGVDIANLHLQLLKQIIQK